MRVGLILLLLVGLLMPRMGAAVAELAGAERMVICRGAELVTVTLAADGTPIETEIAEHDPCLTVAPSAALDRPVAPWRRMTAGTVRPLPVPQPAPRVSPWTGPPPDRGPPSFL